MIPFPKKNTALYTQIRHGLIGHILRKDRDGQRKATIRRCALKTSRRFRLVIWQLRTALCFSGVRSRAYVKRSKC